MQQTFNILDESYLREICLLIYTIIKYQTRRHSAAEIEKLDGEENSIKKRKEGKSNPSPKKSCFRNKITRKVKQQVTPPIHILMQTYHNRAKQAVMKRKILECVSVG